jgi:hypothetical protein
MAYTIQKFYEATGQVVVKFDSGPGKFNVDIPLTVEGLYITGAELQTYINNFEPRDFNERAAKIAVGIPNASDITALVVPAEDEPSLTPEQIAEQLATAETQKAAELDKYIKAALIKYNLIAE